MLPNMPSTDSSLHDEMSRKRKESFREDDESAQSHIHANQDLILSKVIQAPKRRNEALLEISYNQNTKGLNDSDRLSSWHLQTPMNKDNTHHGLGSMDSRQLLDLIIPPPPEAFRTESIEFNQPVELTIYESLCVSETHKSNLTDNRKTPDAIDDAEFTCARMDFGSLLDDEMNQNSTPKHGQSSASADSPQIGSFSNEIPVAEEVDQKEEHESGASESYYDAQSFHSDDYGQQIDEAMAISTQDEEVNPKSDAEEQSLEKRMIDFAGVKQNPTQDTACDHSGAEAAEIPCNMPLDSDIANKLNENRTETQETNDVDDNPYSIGFRQEPAEQDHEGHPAKEDTQADKPEASTSTPANLSIEVIPLFKFPKGKRDYVTLTTVEKAMVDGDQMLNDVLIRFYFMYLTQTSSSPILEKSSFFHSYFFERAKHLHQHGGMDAIMRWSFAMEPGLKSYVFIPIHQTYHWSLVILVDLQSDDLQKPYALYLDSLGISPEEVRPVIDSYLQVLARQVDTINIDIVLKRPFRVLNVPQQQNYVDCGLFVLHYVEKFLSEHELVLEKASKGDDLKDWFCPDEATHKREHIRKLMEGLYQKPSTKSGLCDSTANNDPKEEL